VEFRLLILVRCLMLLACGPLLLPSGLCICQPDVGAATSTQSPEPVAVKGCSHGHCHKAVPAKPAPPQPKKHKPGCPSELAGVDRSQWVEQSASVAAVPPPVSAIDSVAVPPPAVCASRHEVSHYVPSTPVYLSHCALVL
jgi:hypothetical protein